MMLNEWMNFLFFPFNFLCRYCSVLPLFDVVLCMFVVVLWCCVWMNEWMMYWVVEHCCGAVCELICQNLLCVCWWTDELMWLMICWTLNTKHGSLQLLNIATYFNVQHQHQHCCILKWSVLLVMCLMISSKSSSNTIQTHLHHKISSLLFQTPCCTTSTSTPCFKHIFWLWPILIQFVDAHTFLIQTHIANDKLKLLNWSFQLLFNIQF